MPSPKRVDKRLTVGGPLHPFGGAAGAGVADSVPPVAGRRKVVGRQGQMEQRGLVREAECPHGQVAHRAYSGSASAPALRDITISAHNVSETGDRCRRSGRD